MGQILIRYTGISLITAVSLSWALWLTTSLIGIKAQLDQRAALFGEILGNQQRIQQVLIEHENAQIQRQSELQRRLDEMLDYEARTAHSH